MISPSAEQIRERLSKIKPPWRITKKFPMMLGHGVALQRGKEVAHEDATGQVFGLYLGREHELPMDDLDFIANAPSDIAYLLDLLASQDRALEEAQQIIRDHESGVANLNRVIEQAEAERARLREALTEETKRRKFMQVIGRHLGWGATLDPDDWIWGVTFTDSNGLGPYMPFRVSERYRDHGWDGGVEGLSEETRDATERAVIDKAMSALSTPSQEP